MGFYDLSNYLVCLFSHWIHLNDWSLELYFIIHLISYNYHPNHIFIHWLEFNGLWPIIRLHRGKKGWLAFLVRCPLRNLFPKTIQLLLKSSDQKLTLLYPECCCFCTDKIPNHDHAIDLPSGWLFSARVKGVIFAMTIEGMILQVIVHFP